MQGALVMLIVAVSALYCLWALLPLPWRQRLARRLRRRPQGWAQRLAAASEAPGADCAACGARQHCPARRSVSGAGR